MPTSAFDLARGLLAHTLTCDQVRSELTSHVGSVEGPDALVHSLEHFVADQDIRERDSDYAEWQKAELRRLLASDQVA